VSIRSSGFDPAQGPRAEAYRHYRGLSRPRWSLTTRVDVAPLLAALPVWREQLPGLTAFVAYHHAVIRAANAIPQLRQRLVDGGDAIEWERVDGTPTVLRADDSFAVARLPFSLRLRDFAPGALAAVAAAAEPGGPLGFVAEPQAELHMTTLPLVAFTHFSHARGGGFDDATPAMAMGRFAVEGGRTWMPLNVEVHHALVDGVHVGRFVQALESLLAEPDSLW
jgi:chloramphenicol O-acetyltransferase type A